MEFIYSGFALLGVRPADKSAKILELNNKMKEDSEMDEKMLQGFVSDIKQIISETNSKNDELSKTISELNESIADKDKMIAELNASSDELKTALEKAQTDYQEVWKKEDELYNEINKLKDQLSEAQAKERVGEMNSAISQFTDEEKSYAKEEIENFEKDPINCEINSIVTKIWGEIGKKAKENEKIISEQNAASNNEAEDIFAEVSEINSADADDSIF
jgi:chromosome segregation ATPase